MKKWLRIGMWTTNLFGNSALLAYEVRWFLPCVEEIWSSSPQLQAEERTEEVHWCSLFSFVKDTATKHCWVTESPQPYSLGRHAAAALFSTQQASGSFFQRDPAWSLTRGVPVSCSLTSPAWHQAGSSWRTEWEPKPRPRTGWLVPGWGGVTAGRAAASGA